MFMCERERERERERESKGMNEVAMIQRVIENVDCRRYALERWDRGVFETQ